MRSKLFYRKVRKAHHPPGSLIYVGDKKGEKVRVTVLDYDEKRWEEKEVESVEDVFPYRDTSAISWINIDGLHEVDHIDKLGQHFGIHPLVLEDIVNTEQRPKL